MRLGIKDGKIYDICSDIRHKKDDSIDSKDYLNLPIGDWLIGDTWDSEKNDSLKNSLQRFEEPYKSPEQLKIEELETRILALENK